MGVHCANVQPESACLFASDRSLKVCYDRLLANKQPDFGRGRARDWPFTFCIADLVVTVHAMHVGGHVRVRARVVPLLLVLPTNYD